MQSLREKLLKAGLVNEDQAKKAEAEKAQAKTTTSAKSPREPREERPRRDERPRDDRPPRRDDRPRSNGGPERRGPPPRAFEAPRSAPVPKLPPMAGSKEHHRLQAKKQLELDRTLREKVLAAQVAQEPGATAFYFVTRKNRLRRLELSEAQAAALTKGELAVVERPDPDKIEHALVPALVGLEILALSQRAVRFMNREGGQVGFLSDDDISKRAHEADAPETPDAERVTPAPADAAEPGAPAADETWITIKRA
jgi:uncharacterized protein YaiL (DUF2058 family)